MIRFFAIPAAVVLVHVFEVTLLFRAGPVLSRIDLMLLLIAFVALRVDSVTALAIGAAIGIFRHMAWSESVLLGAAAGGLAAWVASEAHRHLVGESFAGLMLILFSALFSHDLLVHAAHLRFGLGSFLANIGLVTIPAAILTALVGAGAYKTARWYMRRKSGLGATRSAPPKFSVPTGVETEV